MNLFEEAYLTVNEEPAQITVDGFDLLYDLFKHLGEGGTIYNHPDPVLIPEACALMMSVCMQTVSRGFDEEEGE